MVTGHQRRLTIVKIWGVSVFCFSLCFCFIVCVCLQYNVFSNVTTVYFVIIE